MNLINLKSYRVRKESSYYNRGYYIADIISMHRCFAALSNTSDKLELEKTGYLGCVASYKGSKVKSDDTILYDPISLYRGSYSDELMYIAAHEVSHIKNNDGFRIRAMKCLLFYLSFCMIIIMSYIWVPLVITVPILYWLMYFATRREIETQADLGALEYISLNTVLRSIGNRGNETRFAWLWYDHTTKKKLLRKLSKK